MSVLPRDCAAHPRMSSPVTPHAAGAKRGACVVARGSCGPPKAPPCQSQHPSSGPAGCTSSPAWASESSSLPPSPLSTYGTYSPSVALFVTDHVRIVNRTRRTLRRGVPRGAKTLGPILCAVVGALPKRTQGPPPLHERGWTVCRPRDHHNVTCLMGRPLDRGPSCVSDLVRGPGRCLLFLF